MRIVTCGLIAGTALLGLAPAAIADVPVSVSNADSRAADSQAAVPQTEVSLLAVSLTVGGAVATAGSGMALVLTRRRAVSRQPSQVSG